MWTSANRTTAVATASAHAPTRRVGAPVAIVLLGGPTTGAQAAKVGVRVGSGRSGLGYI